MIRGGYKIINFGDIPIVTGGAAVEIEGIYSAVRNQYRFATLLSGITLDSKPRSDVWASFEVSGTDYIATVPTIGLVTISNDDTVTIKTPDSGHGE